MEEKNKNDLLNLNTNNEKSAPEETRRENERLESEYALCENSNDTIAKSGENQKIEAINDEKTGEKNKSERDDENDSESEESGLDFSDELVKIITQAKNVNVLKDELSAYHANDIAEALKHITPADRKRVYFALGDEETSEVFSYLDDPDEFIEELTPAKAADIIENMDADDAVDVLDELDEDKKREIIGLMEKESADDVKLISKYQDDEIGSEMTMNFIEIKNDFSVKQAMTALVEQAAENDNISTVYVTDEKGVFCGAIDLRDLFIARDVTPLGDIITTSYPYLYATEKISDCLERIKSYAEDSLPVLDADNRLIGALTSANVVDVVSGEMSEDYAKLAGLSSPEEKDESVFSSLFKRLPWIVLLLCFSLVISAVIGLFEKVIETLPLIVFFQSLVLDMGGNSGTQSLGVTLQELVEEKTPKAAKIIFRETRVAFLGSLILGVCSFFLLGGYMMLFKAQTLLNAAKTSACISGALIIAMTVSGFCGAAIPLLFKKFKKDPAVASGPLITTVNDLVSAVAFYSIAWLFLIVL